MDEPLRQLLQNVLMYVLMPVWMAAGFGDWICHRVLKMECTAGLKEALMHLLMLAELGPCLLLVLFCEVNALVLSILFVACIAHELTLWWDLLYAIKVRRIPVVEQWLHSFQIAAPWVSLGALSVLHWDQAKALLTLDASAQWVIEWKHEPLPAASVVAILCAGFVFIAVPFVEEVWRCWKVRQTPRRRSLSQPISQGAHHAQR